MLNNISNINNSLYFPVEMQHKTSVSTLGNSINMPTEKLHKYTSENIKAYSPSFTGIIKNNKTNSDKIPSEKEQIKVIKAKLNKESGFILDILNKRGILKNNNSNDGSTVLENLYKIASEERLTGLNDSVILSEVIKALYNPFSITQKFGDIPQEAAQEISSETGEYLPKSAYNVNSSACVAASMEFSLAMKNPAEFTRFAQGLSSKNYSVDKNIKMSDIANSTAEGLWKLRRFNTESKLNNWDDITIKIQPDRNAIIRSRIQTSYKDPDERSCVDVLIQSALLNLGSQNSYNSLIDERASSDFNDQNNGLSDIEKDLVERIIFERPKVPVIYQNVDNNGYLQGYTCEPEKIKNHILKSLELGQNVIIGYTDIDTNNRIINGHEITIISYEEDENGNKFFICNDTDDNINAPVKIAEEKLLQCIHHAGIEKDALEKDDIIYEPWRQIINDFQQIINQAA